MYLVAFCDLLGSSVLLDSWKDFRELQKSRSDSQKALLKTITTLLSIRTDFDSLAKGLNSTDQPEELEVLRKGNPDLFEISDALRSMQIRHQSFSDTNIWFVPISDSEAHGHFYARAMNGLITGLSFAHLSALASGILCRSAVAVGPGTDMGDYASQDEIIGPCLLNAYRDETTRADYSRIYVSSDFRELLLERTQSLDPDKASSGVEYGGLAVEKHYLSNILNMIMNDSDDSFILDYAGEEMAQRVGGIMRERGDDPAIFFSTILKSVKDRVETERASGETINRRMSLLVQYLENSSAYWLN